MNVLVNIFSMRVFGQTFDFFIIIIIVFLVMVLGLLLVWFGFFLSQSVYT